MTKNKRKLKPLDDREAEQFASYCRRIAANGHFIPESAFQPLHGLVSWWATEIVITRQKPNHVPEVFLTRYNGGAPWFPGMWHIPGGYNRWFERDIEATCNRKALEELQISVEFVEIMDFYKWQKDEHPYGRPLSLYCHCKPVLDHRRDPTGLHYFLETNKAHFFSIDRLPTRLVRPHRLFLKKMLGQTVIESYLDNV